jgi:hypothetical protein
MTVEALVEYFFMVFLGFDPNKEDLPQGSLDAPRDRWQVILLPSSSLPYLSPLLFLLLRVVQTFSLPPLPPFRCA